MCITENGTHVVALSIDHSADQHPIGLHLVEYHIGLERHEFRCGFFTGRSFKTSAQTRRGHERQSGSIQSLFAFAVEVCPDIILGHPAFFLSRADARIELAH